MFQSHGRLAACSILALAAVSCNETRTVTDLQNIRMDEARDSYGLAFTYMVDNAILNDMSLADFHFVSHTDELNGTGAARLDRMAKLLNVYGGMVRYEADAPDDELVEKRVEHVKKYLALTGCDMDRVDVSVMRTGGRGLPGEEAVRKYQESVTPGDGANSDGASSVPSFVDLGGK